MNPGPVEESAKVATSVVSGLKEQPLALALIVLNILWLVAVFWTSHLNNEREDKLISDLVQTCAAAKSGG
jgi:hypothetical protein